LRQTSKHILKHALLAGLFAPLFALPLVAQSDAHAVVFGGYSYFDGSYTAEGTPPNKPSGWNAAITGNLQHHLGLTADLSGYSQSIDSGDSSRVTNFLFGPTVSVSVRSFSPFAHFLVGVAYVSHTGFRFLSSSNSFAYAAGGGLDYNFTRHFGVRGQVDLLHNNFTTADNQLQTRINHSFPRISTGLVIRF